MSAALHPLHNQLSTLLQTRHNLPVGPQWLNDFLSSRGPNPPPVPVPALLSTAHFRILASDITTSLRPPSAAEALPPDVSDVNVKERRLAGPVVVQILDIIDVGSSRWSQVEALERVERGEEVRGREVIRTVEALEEDEQQQQQQQQQQDMSASSNATANNKLSSGPHKLVLQDAKGTKVLAFELVKVIPGIALSGSTSSNQNQNQQQPSAVRPRPTAADSGMLIGCKILLKPGTVLRRGMAMLTPDNCLVLGGKVEAWGKKWKEDQKQRLIALVDQEIAATTAAGRG